MERNNDTLKNLHTIPVSPVKIASAKIAVLFILGLVYSLAILLSSMIGGMIAGSELVNIGEKIWISMITSLLYTASTLPVAGGTVCFAGFSGICNTLENSSNSVIWNNFSLIFPTAITMIAGYIIERERVDDTLKNILTIPITFRKLLAGKLIAVGGLSILLAVIEFVFTMTVFFISRFPGFSFAGMMVALFKMIGMNLFVYVVVLPIIIFTERAGSFMAGVGFSFFYGFIGTFASGHGLGNIYPVTAGLSLINYQNGEITAYNKVLSTGILFLMFAVSNVMVLFSKNKVPTAKANKKVKKPLRISGEQE